MRSAIVRSTALPGKSLATCCMMIGGNIMKLEAKMIGMTPP